MQNKPILVFQTDFTYKEGAVSSMYGVVKTVDSSLEIMDGSHELPQFDTWSASYRLFQSLDFWPKGTIYVSVVDPGVGTARKACVAKTSNGYYVVTPDNGSLTHVKRFMGIEEVREIDETVNRLHNKKTEGVAIFHGRDLFGYCAARLASGIISFEQVGPAYPVEEIKEHTIHEPTVEGGSVKGIFEIDDPNFGNLWTNIPLKLFRNKALNTENACVFGFLTRAFKCLTKKCCFTKVSVLPKKTSPLFTTMNCSVSLWPYRAAVLKSNTMPASAPIGRWNFHIDFTRCCNHIRLRN